MILKKGIESIIIKKRNRPNRARATTKERLIMYDIALYSIIFLSFAIKKKEQLYAFLLFFFFIN